MSEKKKNAATEEVKEEARKLSEEELEKVNGGIKATTSILASVWGNIDTAKGGFNSVR